MKTYVFFEQKTGRILETLTGSLEVAISAASMLGASLYVPKDGEECPWDANFYIDEKSSSVKQKPIEPSPGHFWDYSTKSWQVDIVKYKNYVWSCIKQHYVELLNEGFQWKEHTFDFDSASQVAITQAAQVASLDLSRTFYWTLKNNTTIPLDSAEMIAVAATMMDKLQSMQTEKQQLREQVNSTYREQVLKDLIPQEK